MALTSFFSALTGLNSSSHTINVIGDNLANMNTVGFKAGKATFAEIIGGMSGFSSTGNPIVFGQGSMLNGVVHKQTDGTPEYTGNSTDAMINGNGYFVVDTGNGAMGYTRAGRFQFDGTGNLISSDGYQLMGYLAQNGKIDQTAGITTIEIRKGMYIQGEATNEMSAAINLDSQALVGDQFATPIEVFDSLGNKHTIVLEFTKGGLTGGYQTWTWEAHSTSSAVIGNYQGTLVFDTDGTLLDSPPVTTPPANVEQILTISMSDLNNGAAGLGITFRLWDDQGNSMITCSASESATSYTKQNGYAPSTLKDVAFDNEGRVIGLTANNQQILLAQMALATFPNTEGLQKFNGSTFTASANAGEPSIGAAGSGGRGNVVGGSLEMSNVDMAEEFINLIIAQRAFQANARVITTSDELYMEAVNLKR